MRVTLESRNRPIANILVQLKHCLLYFLPRLLHMGQSFVLIQQKCNNKSYNFSLKFLLRLPNMSSLFAAGLCLLSVAICYLNLFIDQTEKASTLTGTNVIIKWQCFFLWQRLVDDGRGTFTFFCSHFHFLSHSLVPTFTFTQLVFVLESILSTWAPPDKRLFAALVNLNRQTNDETWQFCNYEIWTEYMTLILVEKPNNGWKFQKKLQYVHSTCTFEGALK